MRTVPIDAALEAVIRRDRVVVITALFTVIALSWAYVLAGAGMLLSGQAPSNVSPADAWNGYGGVGAYRRSNGNTYNVMTAAHCQDCGLVDNSCQVRSNQSRCRLGNIHQVYIWRETAIFNMYI